MNSTTLSALAHWQNFYVLVGTSAGALTGLQFVVMTLIMQIRAARNMRDIHAFGTPTVLHFCTALLLSAAMVAPWPTLASLGLCLGAGGVIGTIYSIRVIWHARQAAYRPDWEDWIWYTVLPLLGHFVLVVAAALLLFLWKVGWSLTLVAGDAVLFLFLGVHNAWDTVTFIAVQHSQRASTEEGIKQMDSDAR